MKKSKALSALNLSLCAFFLIFANEGEGQWSKDPNANNAIITIGGSNQTAPAIVKDFNKGAIIVWQDARGLSVGGTDIYGMRIDEVARHVWSTGGRPLADAVEDQKAPAIIASPDGNFYIAWQDLRKNATQPEIYVQKYELSGLPVWASATLAHTRTNLAPVIFQSDTRILTAAYTIGLFDDVISMQNLNSQNGQKQFGVSDGRQLIVNPNGLGDLHGSRPAVVPGLNGGLIAAWTDARNDTITYIIGIDANGSQWGQGEFPVDLKVAKGTYPTIVSDGNEGAIIFWTKSISEGQDQFITAARYNSEGSPVWGDSFTELINATPGKKINLHAVPDGQNGAYLVWENVNTTRFDTTVHIQRIDSQGSFWPLGDVQIATPLASQLNPAIHAVGDKAVVVWEDKRNITPDLYAQAVDLSGNPLWAATGVAVSTASGKQTNVVLTGDDLGGVIAVWEDTRNTGIDKDIYAQRISKTGVIGEFREISVSSPDAGANWEIGSPKVINWTATEEIERIKIELVINGQDIIPLSEQVNSNPTNGSFTINAVSGSPSNNGKIRITAVEAPFIIGESATFTISSSTGPQLNPDVITELNSGDSLRVVTTATDVSGVKEVTLNYKIGGGLSYSTIAMDSIGANRYEATVPPNFVTSRGVSYFVSGTDNIDVVGSSDTFFVSVNFQAGTQVKLIRTTGYRMISSPNHLAQTLADSIFAQSDFGAYDTTSWRLYKYKDGVYVERDSANADSFRFRPGTAYWLISANERVLEFGSGVSLLADRPFELELQPGWNQIANPFAFEVAWDDVVSESGDPLISVPYEFRGAQYIMPNTLEQYTGFFVYNHEDSVETLFVPPKQVAVNASKLSKQTAQDAWRLQILSSCGEARDDYNYFGVNERARAEFDRLDSPEPPPFGNYISVYFPKKDWGRFSNNYATDFRNDIGDGVELTVHVKTNIANSEAKVQFAGLEHIPAGLEIMLFDEKLNVIRNLRERDTYVFVTGAKTTLKELKLLIGSNEFVDEALANVSLVPEKFELSQNFPNPFNPTTSIRYGLPAAEKVTIRIYDLLGREVRTLVHGDLQKSGYHVTSWNGRDKNEIPVASGVYIYRIKAGKFSQSKKMILVK